MKVCAGSWDDTFDVVVVGSGAAGLTAALSSVEAGATVAVIEKASTLGGTTALSGGMIWIPGNREAAEAGIEDSLDRALTYALTITKGRASRELLQAHLERGTELLEFLERASGLRYSLIGTFPDYHPELEGGSEGGRSIEPAMFDLTSLGDLAQYVRDDPRPPFLQREYFEEWRTYRNFPHEELARRRREGIVTRGRALVAPLVKAIADRGGTIVVNNAVERLVMEDGGVVGVSTQAGDVAARAGVVLASGGFEWSDELCARFLSGPVTTRCSVPTNVGDGLRMAMAAGTDLANMNEAWWAIECDIPGVEAEGRALGTIVAAERSLAGSIVVNRRGERFTNESGSYYEFGKVLAAFDTTNYGYRNLPAYLIADGAYFERNGLLGADDLDDLPDWIASAGSLPELAATLGIDADGLVATVERFNGFAREGFDADFHRGQTVYDRYLGDPTTAHPNLEPLLDAPFVAIELQCGAIGTKGGVRTDVDARALDPWGEPISGLFAVGNVSAHPIAFGYLGAGATLGPAMTMARAAGQAAARARV